MAAIGSVIYAKLVASTAVNTAVKGNIVPIFRDDLVPSLVYSSTIQDIDQRYEGIGAIAYEVSISVIAEKYADANETADLVVTALDYANWTNGTYVVLGSFLNDRDEDYIELTSKNKRLAVVDLKFDLIVKVTA